MGKFSSKSNFRSKIGSLPQFGHHVVNIPMLYLMDDILPFFFRNCTSIKRHYKLWYTLSVAQRLTISFCGLQRLRPIAMSAKVSYGELRDKACDALNAASSVMKNAKTSSTQIAYNVSHNNTAACKPKKLYSYTKYTIYYFYNKGSLTANSTKKGKKQQHLDADLGWKYDMKKELLLTTKNVVLT